MSDEALKALGELAMRINMVRLHARDTEEKLQDQKRVIKKLILLIEMELIAIIILAVGLGILGGMK